MPATPDPEHTWLTLGELARFLNITERHVRRLVSERRIPVTRVGGARGRLRFNQARIQAWLDLHSDTPDGGGRGRAA
jgi:excisionase family DNA binding protein